MRLIDADALIEYIDAGHLRPPTELCFSENDVLRIINDTPTVEVEEPIRCKDCVGANRIDDFYVMCRLRDSVMIANGYCSLATRKEHDETD